MAYVIPYTGNLEWLVDRTIFYTVHGSRCYGTNRPDSDYDYKGIAVPPKEYRSGFVQRFEQAIWNKPEDATIFEVRKFFALAADCNPNIVELLYVDPSDILVCTEAGKLIVDNRDMFLSRKASFTFRGYAMAQLKRIRTHRRWLLHPPDHQPTRAEFNLPDKTLIPADQLAAAFAAIKQRMDGWEVDFGDLDEAAKIHIQEQVANYLVEVSIGAAEEFKAAGRLLGYDDNFLQHLDQTKRYNAALDEYRQFQEWKTTRNEKRAALEAKYGYDTKHGMHLVRLMRMGREILTEGVCITRRPDAKELLEIRDGAWSYDKIVGWAEDQDVALLELADQSKLPKAPNRKKLDTLCLVVTQSFDP